MGQLVPFFIVLLAAVLFSEVFKRLHLPWVAALILAGMAIGPFGAGLFEVDNTLEFIGQMGLMFLMFVAGLETKLSSFKKYRTNIIFISSINGLLPFLVGINIGLILGFDIVSSAVMGIIFISSAIAVVIPSLESNGLIESKIGKSIVASTIVEDVVSLLMLSVLIHFSSPQTNIPLPVLYATLLILVLFFRWIIPKIQWFFSEKNGSKDLFYEEVRLVFALLIGIVISFDFLGIHPIVGGFFAGLILSDSINSKILEEKIRVISYGIFIPVFFVIVGSKTDLSVFEAVDKILLIVLLIVFGSMVSKFVSGYLSARHLGFNKDKSFLTGVATLPQLSVTLAIAFTGVEMGLIDVSVASALVILSVISSFLSPLLVKFFAGRINVKTV